MYGLNNGIPVSLKSIPSFGIAPQNQLTAAIQSLFWDGSQGWWYDDDDTSTLFQDSTGTTPVTAVEQFVGLQLDKSQGAPGNQGPDIIVNGDYSAGTANWTAFGTNLPTLSAANNQLTVSLAGPSGSAGAYQAITTVIGKWYIVRAPQINLTGVSPRLRVGTTIDGSENANVIVSNTSNSGAIFLATSTTTYISLRATLNTAGVDVIWGPVSTRELPGNHRYATASGTRPVWSKRVNLLTKTEQFDDAAWTNRSGLLAFGSGSVANTTETTDPIGGNTADLLAMDGSTGTHTLRQDLGASSTGNSRKSIRLKYKNWQYFYIQGPDSTTVVVVDLINGVVTSSGGNATNVVLSSLGNGWFDLSFTSNEARYFILGFNNGSSYSASFTGTSGAGVYIWGADLRPANQATGTIPLYQRVNTSTDYDTNGFPGYLRADGLDDFLVTNSINFGTDKITLCAGLRKLSDATLQTLYELSANFNTNNGVFNASPGYSGAGSGVGAYWFAASKGTTSAFTVTTATFPAPQTAVQTHIGEISTDTALLRINGTQVATSATDQGTGNYGNYPAYFFRRGGTANPFNGYEYSNIAVGKLLTASQLASLEQYMNEKTRAY